MSKLLPLVYSCSGCSNVAQLANSVALKLNQLELAEMSCIAGVGGHVKMLVNKAKAGRPIIALDGCPLHCVKNCLAQHQLTADQHYDLSQFGFKKQYRTLFSEDDIEQCCDIIVTDLSIS